MWTWEPVIGLEVHVQLATRSKLFCRCESRFGAPPNSLVCPICLGYPGALPVANERAIELAAALALALGAEVHERSEFSRKNYFYPDLPKGYQISQYDRPLATGGALPLETHGRSVRLHRLHLEEDAGKLLHEAPGGAPLDGISLVDFNRAGVPLVEIVTEPDLASAAEAEEFLRSLHQLLIYSGASDGSMEEGSLRCDANISLRRAGTSALGVKVEIKNLNSFRHVARAIDHEISRQSELLESGREILQETRGFDEATGSTWSLRSKEEAHDYRYFPDPDLPEVVVSVARMETLRAGLAETPWRRRERLRSELGLTDEDLAALTAERALVDYFEAIVAVDPELSAQSVANWVRNETLREIKERQQNVSAAPAPARVAELLGLVRGQTVSLAGARAVHSAIWESSESATAACERLGLRLERDDSKLTAWVEQIVRECPDQIAELRSGKEQVLAFLTGRVMKLSQGRADARRAQEILREHATRGERAGS